MTRPAPAERIIRARQPGTDFEHSISFFITVLANRKTIAVGRILQRELGLSVTEWRILALLAVEPGSRPARLIEVAAVDKSSVSRGVARLQRRGLIAVEPDAANRRRLHLFLTEAGLELHHKGLRLSFAGDEALLAGMNLVERRVLIDGIRRLIENVAKLE